MRPKARVLAQHGGPPGCRLEESDQAECDFVHDGRSMPPALTDRTTCPEAEFLDVIGRKVLKVTSTTGFYSPYPSPLEKKWFEIGL